MRKEPQRTQRARRKENHEEHEGHEGDCGFSAPLCLRVNCSSSEFQISDWREEPQRTQRTRRKENYEEHEGHEGSIRKAQQASWCFDVFVAGCPLCRTPKKR